MHFKAMTLLGSLALPLSALGADSADSHFYRTAAEGNMAEVELGNLAQQKSSNATIKEFGAIVTADHGSANEKLQSIADAKGVSLPRTIGVKEMAIKAKLEVLSGEAFDRAYVKDMVKDHKEDIALFEEESAHGRDPEARAFATATLPTLRMHLKKIEEIADGTGRTAAN